MKAELMGIILCCFLLSCNKTKNESVFHNSGFDNSVLKSYYRINNTSDTLLVTSNGARLFVPAFCFEWLDEKKSEDLQFVEVYVEEYNSVEQFIFNDISTFTQDGKALKSGGMLNIEALVGEEKLNIKKGKFINVKTNGGKLISNAKLFKGIKEQETIIWKEIGTLEEEKKECENLFFLQNDTLFLDRIYGVFFIDADADLRISLSANETSYANTINFLRRIEYFGTKPHLTYYLKNYNKKLQEVDDFIFDNINTDLLFKTNSSYYRRVSDFLNSEKDKPYVRINDSEIDFVAMQEKFCKFSKIDPDFKKNYDIYNLYILRELLGIKNDLNTTLKFQLFNYDFNISELGWYNIDKYTDSAPFLCNFNCNVSEPVVQYDAYLISKKENVCITLKLFKTDFSQTGILNSRLDFPSDIGDLRLVVLGLTSQNEFLVDSKYIDNNTKTVLGKFNLKKVNKENIKNHF